MPDTCPRCHTHVDRAQPSTGAVIAYPCRHWLTPKQATGLPTTTQTAKETRQP